MKNLKLSKELIEILSSCWAKMKNEGKKKELTLESVLQKVLDLMLSGGGDDALKEYKNLLFERTELGDPRSLVQFNLQIDKFVIAAEEMNVVDEDLENFYDTDSDRIIVSGNLKDVIDRSNNIVSQFGLTEITPSLFLLQSLHTKDNRMINYLKSKRGFDAETISAVITVTEISALESIFNNNKSTLKEKNITSGEKQAVEPTTEDTPSAKNNSDDFQKAGQKGSVSSKAIDPKSKTPFLDEFAYDMTQAARDGKYDPVIGRDRELDSLIEILACRKKNNAILLGEPGCGKTSVVEALVERIASKRVPYELRNKRVVSLDLNALVAGAIYRGEYEKRLQGIIKEVVECKNIIVFIDEVHNLIGNGSSSGQGDGANILKPYLARGEFQLIGATTKMEYRAIEKDGALKRRFQNVIVEDPTDRKSVV